MVENVATTNKLVLCNFIFNSWRIGREVSFHPRANIFHISSIHAILFKIVVISKNVEMNFDNSC